MKLLTGSLIVLAIGAVLVWMGWTIHASGILTTVRSGGPGVFFVIIAGVGCTGLLAGVLMWLAFYSSRRGFDDRATPEPGSAEDDET